MFDRCTHPARLTTSFVLMIVFLGPVLVLAQSLIDAGGWDVLSVSRHGPLLAKTTLFAAAVTVGCTALGVAAASAVWVAAPRLALAVALGLLSLLALPPYLYVLVWQTVADLVGWGDIFRGWAAAFFVQVVALAPLATGLVLLALMNLDTALIQAARIAQDDGRVMRQVVLPLAAPAIKATSAIVFLFTVTDYTVSQSFQRDTYAFEVFAEFSYSYVPGRATMIALPAVALASIVLGFLLRQLGRVSVRRVQPCAYAPLRLGGLSRLLQHLALSLLLLQAIVLVVGLGSQLTGISGLSETVSTAALDVGQSAATALLAAVLALPLCFAAAHRVLRGGLAGKFWLFAVAVPLALPGPLVGIGLVSLWNQSLTAWVYDSGAVVVLTGLTRFLPLATLVAMAGLMRVDQTLLDAARVFAPGRVRHLSQVYVPMLLPSGLAVVFLVFVLTLSELPASLLTAPAGSGNLAARIYGYLHYGASDRVAELMFVLPALAVFAATGVGAIMVGWRILLPRVPHGGSGDDSD